MKISKIQLGSFLIIGLFLLNGYAEENYKPQTSEQQITNEIETQTSEQEASSQKAEGLCAEKSLAELIANCPYTPDWLKQAQTSEESISVNAEGYVTWHNGIWNYGTWKDGTWHDGTWKRGIWIYGTWKRGIWIYGTWKGESKGSDFDPATAN